MQRKDDRLLARAATCLFLVSGTLFSACGPADSSSVPFAAVADRDIAARRGQCDAKKLEEIAIPFDYHHPVERIQYAYRFDRPRRADGPVVVLVPGGPGLGMLSMADAPPEHDGPGSAAGASFATAVLGIPADYGVLYLDPRGVGCNAGGGVAFPDNFYNSEFHARDILAILAHHGIQNYTIYGHSYGTVVATMLAHFAEQDSSIPGPKAVVLEGVMGRHFEVGENSRAHIDEWNKRIAHLPPHVGRRFGSGRNPPLGVPFEAWAEVSRDMLSEGSLPFQVGEFEWAGLDFMSEVLMSVTSRHPERLAYAKDLVRDILNDRQDSEREKLFQLVACSEITNDFVRLKFSSEGKLEFDGPSPLCGSLRLHHERKYDAKNFPIKAPISYFQGDADPATPIWQAQYHYDAQSGAAARSLFRIAHAGHMPLGRNLKDCAPRLWKKLVVGASAESEFKTCRWHAFEQIDPRPD